MVNSNILDGLRGGKFLRCWGPKLCFQSKDPALLATNKGVTEKRRSELLQQCRQQDIEVYVALQVSCNAQVILQSSQYIRVSHKAYGLEFFIRGDKP